MTTSSNHSGCKAFSNISREDLIQFLESQGVDYDTSPVQGGVILEDTMDNEMFSIVLPPLEPSMISLTKPHEIKSPVPNEDEYILTDAAPYAA